MLYNRGVTDLENWLAEIEVSGVVWCGVVWCGVVWCGVVWCGVVWCGVVSCRVVSCRVVYNGKYNEDVQSQGGCWMLVHVVNNIVYGNVVKV